MDNKGVQMVIGFLYYMNVLKIHIHIYIHIHLHIHIHIYKITSKYKYFNLPVLVELVSFRGNFASNCSIRFNALCSSRFNSWKLYNNKIN